MSVSMCPEVCVITRAKESDQVNQRQPRCMVWIRRLISDIRNWHTRECHGSVWWLVHPNYAVILQRPSTKTHMHMKCTWTHTRPQHSTIQRWPQIRIILPFVLGGAKENRLRRRRRGGEKGSICLWISVRKPFSAVSSEWSASTSGLIKIHWHWLWLQLWKQWLCQERRAL